MTQRHDDAATRRQVLRAGLAAVGAAAVTATAQAQTKIAQSQVQYQQQPNPDGQHCSICVNFIAPASCQIVDGKINPNGWCIAFAPKA